MTLQPRIDISTTALGADVNQEIYGHFLEAAFFGNIEGGLLDEGSPLSISEPGPLQGARADVLEACRELGIPVLRWPGGNFTSPYWWEDGTGPRDARPRRLELAWGSEETNRFGTPEFLAWCDAIGAEPYLAHHCRNVDDAVRWVEYTNYGGDTAYTARRRDDGHPAPYGVRYWGLGNEVYGRWQMGHRDVERYVADAQEHARFMRLVDPDLSFIACGWDREHWTEQTVRGLGDVADYFSLHHYGASRHLTDPSVEEFDAVVAQALYFEAAIVDFSRQVHATATRAGIERPLQISMDEWNMRHLEPAAWPQPQPGPDGGVAPRDLPAESEGPGRERVNRSSPRTLADALFYAGVFHAMHRSAALPVPVGMANTVNLINANGLINVRPEGLVKHATYHVWDLYQNHFGSRPVALQLNGPARFGQVRLGHQHDPDGSFQERPMSIGLLDASAALTDDGSELTLAVINRSADTDIAVDLSGDGRTSQLPATARRRVLAAAGDDLFATNSINEPDRVTLSGETTVEIPDTGYVFDRHSITLLTFDLTS